MKRQEKDEGVSKNDERFHQMIEEVEDYAIILLDTNGNILHWNKGAERIKGYKPEEVIGKSFTIFYTEEQMQNGLPFALLKEASTRGRVSHEGWRVRKNGSTFWGTVVMTAIHNAGGEVIGFSKLTRDLTESRLADEKLREYTMQLEHHMQELEGIKDEVHEKNIVLGNLIREKDTLIEDKDKLIREKEWLVKEIHHRVKNNLQMIISLLNVQSEFLRQRSALNAIRESRDRIQAIAIVYQNFYQFDNDTQINMRTYVTEYVDSLKYGIADISQLIFELDIADIALDAAQAVPLGLILNEAVTNAIKHAYGEKKKGVIRIYLERLSDDIIQLKVEDTGKGLPSSLNVLQSNTLGFELMNLFAEQLDAELSFKHEKGVQITLIFKIPQSNHSNIKKVHT
jgi:PAS domain S-box-containing protein